MCVPMKSSTWLRRWTYPSLLKLSFYSFVLYLCQPSSSQPCPSNHSSAFHYYRLICIFLVFYLSGIYMCMYVCVSRHSNMYIVYTDTIFVLLISTSINSLRLFLLLHASIVYSFFLFTVFPLYGYSSLSIYL